MTRRARAAGVVLVVLGALTFWMLRPGREDRKAEAPAAPTAGAWSTPRATSAPSGEAPRRTAAPSLSGAARVRPEGRANAADLYKNALVIYQKLTANETQLFRKRAKEAEAEEARALFEKLRPILDLLRRAKTENLACDWGISIESIETPLPHLPAIHSLSKAAQWAADYEFAADPQAALEDLAAAAKLGHSIGDQMLLGWIVGGATDHGIISVLQENAGLLSAELLPRAGELVGSPGELLEEFAQANLREADALHGFTAGLDDGALLARWREIQSAEIARELEGKSPHAFRQQITWLENLERDFATKAALPDAEFNAWWARMQAEGPADGSAKKSFEMLGSMREIFQRREVEQAMASAALAILAGGPQSAGAVKDPSTGRPFGYTALENGFELRSPFMKENKPLSMQFSVAAPGR